MELVDIELAWCRSVGLSGRVAAYALRDEWPSLVVLDIEGPAAQAYLQMEQGLHRRRSSESNDERVRVDVVVQGARPSREPVGIRAVRQQTIALGVEVAYRARVGLKTRAMRLELLGPERGLLAHVVHDLTPAWDAPTGDPPGVVRIYREDGKGARDPRTGGLVASYKDVLRGRLDPLLEAWRRWRVVDGR